MHNSCKEVVVFVLTIDKLSNDDSSTNKDLYFIQNNFQNIDLGKLEIARFSSKRSNPMSLLKNWYPRPTPPNLQFEIRDF